MLIVTRTPKVDVETTIHDGFAVAAPGDGTPGNDALDVATTVLPRRPDFAAAYVPASAETTWITDATQWVRGNPVATMADPTVALIGLPGGGSGGPVTIKERPCGGAFACMRVGVNGVSYPAPKGVFGNLVSVTIPPGYGPSNPVTAIFLDNWSVVGWGRDPFKVSYQDDTTGRVHGPPAVVRRVEAHGTTLRVDDEPALLLVERLRERRPADGRPVHEELDVRARPVGRAR